MIYIYFSFWISSIIQPPFILSYADASISSQSPKLPQMALSRFPFLSALFILFVRQGRLVTHMQYAMPSFTVRLRNDSIKQRSGLGFPWLTSTMPVSRRVHTCSRTTSSSWHSRGFPVWPSVLSHKLQALHF